MTLEEHFESFTGDSPVEEQVLMVKDKEKGGGAGFEILQVSPLNTESTVAPLIRNANSMVVDLVELDVLWQTVIVA